LEAGDGWWLMIAARGKRVLLLVDQERWPRQIRPPIQVMLTAAEARSLAAELIAAAGQVDDCHD
jgi:hypothetical protein